MFTVTIHLQKGATTQVLTLTTSSPRPEVHEDGIIFWSDDKITPGKLYIFSLADVLYIEVQEAV